jgi:uncharacterized protein YjiS (DUF1127 family)
MTTYGQEDDQQKTARWYWLLFESGLSTLQAKRYLHRWQQQERSVTEVLDRLPDQHQDVGLTREEAQQLRPPASLPTVHALRWNAPHYPDGLRDLPLKRRPALLFGEGRFELLARPIVTFFAKRPNEDELAMLREAISVLLGENLLLAALANTVQAKLLLEEMAYSDGEILLVATSGMDTYEVTGIEASYIDAGRLVIATPLPPSIPANPKLKPLLQQIATAASARRILASPSGEYDAGDPPRPTLALMPDPPRAKSPLVNATDNAADVLLWVQDPDQDLQSTPQPSTSQHEPLDTPMSPEQTLTLLEQSGDVPPALRARLTDVQES